LLLESVMFWAGVLENGDERTRARKLSSRVNHVQNHARDENNQTRHEFQIIVLVKGETGLSWSCMVGRLVNEGSVLEHK
jgi:hypothetical protein